MMFDENQLQRALQETQVKRERRSRLLTVGSTELPYVLLSASVVNEGDTAVRQGLVRVESPTLLLLNRPHQFEGFEDDGDEHGQAMVAMGRVARFPPGKYSNIDTQLDIFEGSLEEALARTLERLDAAEDLQTGVLVTPPDIWALGLLIYVGKMVAQSAQADLEHLLTRPRLPRHWS